MMELRTYTLTDATALKRYVSEFWPRHILSLRKFGITVHGVWTDSEADELRVIALVGYAPGEEPLSLAENYRNSREFVEDHLDFDPALIITTHTQSLQPIASSPLH